MLSALRSMLRTDRAFVRFAAVGVIGFIVDCGIFSLLIGHWNVFVVRSISFVAAVTATWLCNRNWTFGSARKLQAAREWAMYASGQVLGAFLSLGVYLALIAYWPALRELTIVPFAMGAAAALAFNFAVASRVIYRTPIRKGET